MKLQNDFHLKPTLLNELEQTSSKCISEKLRKKLFVLQYTNIDNVKIFCVIHDKVVLLTRRCSEWKSSPKIFGKVFYPLENVDQKMNFLRTVSRTGTGTDQNFSIGCRYFLKKRKLPVQTKTLLFVAGIFLVVIFLFPCDIVVICLCPTYRVMMA